MKKISLILMVAILLTGGAVVAMSTPSVAQGYEYPPPPADIYGTPWVGPDTPWVYYNGDWFLNGILYYFFGPQYGWAPYYAYPPIYIVRAPEWYAPRWVVWYERHPVYLQNFVRTYPYWRAHRIGERYGREFYEQHHRGQGGGWEKGFHGRPAPPAAHPEGVRPAPAPVAPSAAPRPAPARVAPSEVQRPAPARVAPPEGQRPAPGRVAPSEAPRPAPARVAPPEGQRPAPSHAAPPKEQKAAPQKPEKAAPGEEKH